MRPAVYFAPSPDSALWRRASAWLGRDAYSGQVLPRPDELALEGVDADAITAAPRRYGFHATMKAPFRLADGVSLDDLAAALDVFCARRQPFAMPLKVARLGDFLALVPDGDSGRIDVLAAACVTGLEFARAPLTADELARRRAAGLSAREEQLLRERGYPYVLDRFSFHMSLTGALQADLAEPLLNHLHACFAAVLAQPVRIDSLALFVEPEPGADFIVHSVHPLLGTGQRAAAAHDPARPAPG